jgi:4-amino-4-deoxychorismate lyase
MRTRVVMMQAVVELDATAPVLRADDLGVLRGESVFETMRIGRGRPYRLAEHLARLARSAERVAIPLPGGWEELAAVACQGVDDGVLRLVCSKGAPDAGPVGFALVTAVPEEAVRGRENGVSAITLTLGVPAAQREDAPWLLGGVKATSYAVNMATLRHAQAEGADDAIWVSSDGQVLEAPTAAVGVVLGGTLVSPPPGVGILPGTTLAAMAEHVPFESRQLSVEELRAADEVLLLSSVRGVAPVVRLDGRALELGEVTKRLRAAYEDAVRGE